MADSQDARDLHAPRAPGDPQDLHGGLPDVLPLFPLRGVILLPGASLPLHIFEPRYRRMLADALAGHKLIGMIQPRLAMQDGPDMAPEIDLDSPPLCDVGCAGRVVASEPLAEGRSLIVLRGVARFRLARELAVTTPYRQARVEYASFEPFASGAPGESGASVASGGVRNENERAEEDMDLAGLLLDLRRYVAARGLKADLSGLGKARPEEIVNALSMNCPFTPAEKQELLEARTLKERRAALRTLLVMNASEVGGAGGFLH